MNHLAVAVKKYIEHQEDLQNPSLSAIEVNALKSIEPLNRMSQSELTDYLQKQDGPVDWLIGLPRRLLAKENR